MFQAIKIAILDAVPRVYWSDDEGIIDAQKFVDLLAPENRKAQLDTYFVSENNFPTSIHDYDAYLLTGSPLSANDDLEWIQRLSNLVLEADQYQKRIVASCFGHQLVAKAFGGEVRRNEQGWAIGNYMLDITRQYDWMEPYAARTGLYHFNQERVTRLPEIARSFAHTEEYPDYAYTLGDNILSLQGHPEQPKRAMNNFLAATVEKMTPDEVEKARAYIDNGEPDSHIWAKWMMRFFVSD
jgi:GMP synthase-like glutamine amidotransferase